MSERIFDTADQLYRVLGALFQRLAADPEVARGLLAGQFVLRMRYREPEGQVTVDLRGEAVRWEFGQSALSPDLELIQSGDIAHLFWLGQLSIPRAIATRQVVARGPVAKALKLLPALKPAYPLYRQVLEELGEAALIPDTPASGPGPAGPLGAARRTLQRRLDALTRMARRHLPGLGGGPGAGTPPAELPALGGCPLPLLDEAPLPSPTFRDPGLPLGEPDALARAMLERMLLIRAFELHLSRQNARGEIPTEAIHLSVGQEAVAVGACFALRGDDAIATTHRGHGHMLAKGADLDGMAAELLAKESGLCRGKGGSMHVTDAAVGALGANGIVGASPLLAAGAAHAAKLGGSDRVALAFMGDGATNQGMFHEALNFAAVFELPVVMLVENNLYGEFTPLAEHVRVKRLADRAAAYGIPGEVVDGNDVWAVYQEVGAAVERARSGGGPTLLECLTYRWHGHMEGEPGGYRSDEEVAQWKERCPIKAWRERLEERGLLRGEEADALGARAEQRVAEAFARAEGAPEPGPEALLQDVYAPEPRRLFDPASEPAPDPEEPEISCAEALRQALVEELRRDEAVYLLGEDVSAGGYFAVTAGIAEQVGPGRVLDTPISEYAIVGSAVGAALCGRRPVCEILFADFLTTCMDPLVNQAAKLRYMSGGQVAVPLVVRTPGGGGLGMAAQHSQSLEALLCGVPGLIVVAPATPRDAKGLLKAAIRSNNPVLFCENKLLYAATGPVPTGDYTVPLGVARVAREGDAVTLVSLGAVLDRALAAAGLLAAEGVEVEVIDLRSLLPLDLRTLVGSVQKTGRLVTVEEGHLHHGFGGEVVARVCQHAFAALEAPPRRVAGLDVPMPYNRTLENAAVPDEERIAEALRRTLP